MNIRESMEQRERELLSPYASHSADTRGREHPEEECDVRTTYQRDRDRILHCKAFRRMKDKTQVFLAPQGDHYRTRLTHTLEVSQIARTIAKALRLNEDLVKRSLWDMIWGIRLLDMQEREHWIRYIRVALHTISRASGLWKYWRRTETD